MTQQPNSSSAPSAAAEPTPAGDGWHDAARTAWWEWERLSDARTPIEAAQAMVNLSNAMSDLVTWLPDWDADRGMLRGDADG
jgi:hypothetical protein